MEGGVVSEWGVFFFFLARGFADVHAILVSSSVVIGGGAVLVSEWGVFFFFGGVEAALSSTTSVFHSVTP